nr:uncharacterized protein LOC112025707 [Quercus suber]
MVERVEHLLDRDRRAWDINKVRNTFLPFEAETILGILISPSLPNDSRIWAWTSNGIFSVRSAYGVALKVLNDNKKKEEKGECSDSSSMGKVKEEARDIDWIVFATTAWSIWNNRNSFKFEGKFKPGKRIVSEVARYVEEFQQGFNSNSTIPKQPPRLGSQWRALDAGWYKVNVDVVVFKEAGSCGVGVVVRNEDGCLMGAMSKKIPFPLGPLEAEARAAEEGIALARDLGLNDVIIEGDTKTVMSTLANSDLLHTPSSILKVMEGAKFRLQAFKSWQTRHVHRSCNVAAHMLAKHACNVTDSLIWVEDTPPMISAQICMDVVNLGLSLN